MKKIIAVFLVIAVIGGGIWYFTSRNSKKGTYSTEDITRGSIKNTISASGSLAAITTVEVGSQVSGNIEKLYVDFNDEVKSGQLIAQLEDEIFEAHLTQAVANLESAKANEMGNKAQRKILHASLITANADIKICKANIRKAEIALEDAERHYGRTKKLFERKLISEAERDSSLTAFETQKTSLMAITAQLESAKAKIQTISAQFESLDADHSSILAKIKQMEAQHEVAKINLNNTQIYSPIDGVIIDRDVDEGQTVAASLQTPRLFVIAKDLRKMQIDTAVDEADIGVIKMGQKVSFTVDAYNDKTFEGIVEQVRLAPQGTSVITYSVMVTVDNSSLFLKPGMTANTEIVIDERDNALRLPYKAVYFKAPEELLKTASKEESKGKGKGKREGKSKDKKEGKRENKKLDGSLAEKGKNSGIKAENEVSIWIMEKSEKPVLKKIETGISSMDFVEIISDNLKEGDKVIVAFQSGDTSVSTTGRRSSIKIR